MVTDNGARFCILTIFVSKSLCFTNGTDWKKLIYTGPVTLNYYSFIQTSTVISCTARCWPLYKWDQIHFRGEDCYCLAPVYAEAGEISGTMTTDSSIWTIYHDTYFCSEKGYTIFPNQGYCLKYFLIGKPWDVAETRCREDGGHLVSVRNNQDLINLRSLNLSSSYVYVGAHRTLAGTQFVWIPGGTVNESFWKSGQPNNRFGKENCVEFAEDLNDSLCHEFQHFVCQILTN